MQWAFVQPDAPSPALPTTVLFTSLAAYKAHGTYAQPALCLTHYTDLAATHGLVLLRGEITQNEQGRPALSAVDAQLLCLRLQQYFGADEGTERRASVESFHGKGEQEFDLAKLVASAWQV